jgi:transposase
LKKYVARLEAAKKFQVSYQSVINWERKGLLKPHDPVDVGYPLETNRSGRRVEVVYDESQVEILARKVVRDANTIRHNRIEAEAFDLLAKGATVIQLVKQLKINRRTAQSLREFYQNENDGVWVSGDKARAIRALGFPFTKETADADIARLVDRVYGRKNEIGVQTNPRRQTYDSCQKNTTTKTRDADGQTCANVWLSN